MGYGQLTAGVVGAGDIATSVHLPVYANDDRVELLAVADLDRDRRTSAKRSFGLDRTYADGVELIESEDLDLVSICTPIMTHEELFLTAAEHGIDIFCVKPFSETVESARRMQRAADENDIVVQIGYMYRFTENFDRARHFAQNDLMGEIRSLSTSFHSRPPDMGWYYRKEFAGGGTVKRIFCHHLDFYLELFDTTPTVERAVVEFNRTDSVEDFVDVALTFDDVTVSATLSDMQESYSIHQNHLVGTNGAIDFNQDHLSGDIRGNVVNYKHGEPPFVDLVIDQFWLRTSDDYKPRRVTDFIDHVVDGDRDTAAPVSRGVEIAEITEEIYETAEVI
jgi:predicted dehydrogenase